MSWIIESALKFRYLMVVGAIALMLFGVSQVRDTAVDVFPEFEPPRVEIQTEGLGLSAVEVEELITLNLEELLASTAEVEEIRSRSLPGLSSIVLTFKPDTDPNLAR